MCNKYDGSQAGSRTGSLTPLRLHNILSPTAGSTPHCNGGTPCFKIKQSTIRQKHPAVPRPGPPHLPQVWEHPGPGYRKVLGSPPLPRLCLHTHTHTHTAAGPPPPRQMLTDRMGESIWQGPHPVWHSTHAHARTTAHGAQLRAGEPGSQAAQALLLGLCACIYA